MSGGTELFSLTGKTVLITGATGYLGAAMVQAMSAAGAHVLLNTRSHQRGTLLLEELSNQGFSVELAVFDVSDEAQVREYMDEFSPRELHVLINNAYTGAGGTVETSSGEAYSDAYDVSVVAAHNVMKYALPALRRAVRSAGEASVINLGSMYGVVSPDSRVYESAAGTNPPFYGAAKAAMIHWSKYAACEFGKEGIRVNSISPGPFPSLEVQRTAPEFIARLQQKVPMGRIGQANEIMGPVLFLASSAASFVNGTNLIVDGGWTAW
ncbi:SDR family oxidoreductase [Pseudomonas veronii]|uniref:SDR family oxidoreductase n=1 Tax=Pseudomonas veronii TaxID=76761 RepID=A0A7Y1A985_PSEVE|nr:SDR family oxidoreductase [Pseudomonas veronii]NMY11507.1 SDR family oxidoreductase [Pseudomonas veronii]